MARMMRCHTAFWAGDKFIPQGAVRPEGDPDVIPVFFEVFIDEAEKPSTGSKKDAASKKTT